jgi:hypothetical protein
MRFEGDLGDAALLRYAQEQAITWGAERFATEFKRRELEERWIEAAESHTTPYSPTTDPAQPDMLSGPVDAAVQDAVVGSGPGAEIRLSRPAHERHPSVPRPPEPEPEPVRRRLGRRDRARSVVGPAPMISPAEIARMSAASRRLYGLDDPE